MVRTIIKLVDEKELERIAIRMGDYLVVIGREPCLTCGHKKQLIYPEKTDGRVEVIRKCLFCLCRIHTFSNRTGP